MKSFIVNWTDETFSATLQLRAFTVELWKDPLQETFVLEQQHLTLWLALPMQASAAKHCSLYNKGSFHEMHFFFLFFLKICGLTSFPVFY